MGVFIVALPVLTAGVVEEEDVFVSFVGADRFEKSSLLEGPAIGEI